MYPFLLIVGIFLSLLWAGVYSAGVTAFASSTANSSKKMLINVNLFFILIYFISLFSNQYSELTELAPSNL
jgi:hypothetical protein